MTETAVHVKKPHNNGVFLTLWFGNSIWMTQNDTEISSYFEKFTCYIGIILGAVEL